MGLNNTAGIGLIGFGEAGRAFAAGWGAEVAGRCSAYDIKLDDPVSAPAIADAAKALEVESAPLAEVMTQADQVFCVVTAEQAEAAARAAVDCGLRPGTLWLDCNSCAPETKKRAALLVEGAGGRYVDVAVMAPVYPKRHEVPLKIAGPHADVAKDALETLGMKPQIAGSEVGQASSIKMIRSVMIKGLEALTTECMLAARQAGVEEAVFASLEASDPDIRWRKRGSYNLERMMVHGQRRAAEMREVAKTLEDLGLPNGMVRACVDWQERVSSSGAEPGEDDLLARLDAVLQAIKTD